MDATAQIGLTEDQVEFQAVAQDFAEKELLPFAAEWDACKHFPVDKLRAAAQLGFGGILVGDDVGQQVVLLAARCFLLPAALFTRRPVAQGAVPLAEQMQQ